MDKENQDQNQDNEGQGSPDSNNGQDQGNAGNAPDKSEKTVPYTRFQQVNDAKKQAEETLTALVDELKDEVPEEHRDLIPGVSPAEQIKWIRSAMKKGLFTAPAPSGPDSKRPGGNPGHDLSGLSPSQMIEMGLKAQK